MVELAASGIILGHYSLGLVALSLGVAVLTAYTTLSLGQKVIGTAGTVRWLWLLGGGTAMGIGIWATHFVAMLAFEMPLTVQYDPFTTGLSLAYGILAAAVALWLAERPMANGLALGAGGSMMGLAITWMHYTGMAAMKMPAHITYRWPLVATSVVMAMVAATVALGLRQMAPDVKHFAWFQRLAVLVLAAGIGGLHYTGMMATQIWPDPSLTWPTFDQVPHLESRWLALAVAVGAGLMLWLALLAAWVDQRLKQQRVKAEALSESEQRFRTLIRDMGVGVLMLNAKAEIMTANQAARRLLGLPEDTNQPVVFGQFATFLREDGSYFALHDLPVQQAIAHKIPCHDAVMGVSAHHGDRPTWLLVNVDPQQDDQGQVECAVCTCSDITIQKQAEDAVRAIANREKAITRIVQQMRQTLDLETIFSATTQALQQSVDCDRVWIYQFNPDWSGTVVAEFLTDPLAQSTLIQDPSGDRLVDEGNCGARQLQSDPLEEGYLLEDTYLQATQAETYRTNRTFHCVNDIYTRGFSPCYLGFLEQWQVRAYIIVPIFAGGQLWGLLGIYQHHQPRLWTRHEVKLLIQVGNQLGTAVQQADLLHQTQQQAEALALAKRAADAASQAKGEFLASMSHELRTPLNAILGFTQILSEDATLQDNHRHLIGIVNRSGNHLLGLINDVLSLAKIEANKLTLDEESFDLSQLLQGVGDMLQIKAKAKGICLLVSPPPAMNQHLWTDAGKLRQILINLVGNAIKFTHQGSVVVRSRLEPNPRVDSGSTFPKTHCLVVEVQDTGVGMAPAEMANLFQPFEQTQSGRQSAEGTGLGLSLSYRFAQLMGGEIQVDSRPDEGSIFTVTLPVSLTTLDHPSDAQPQSSILRLSAGQAVPRILVVDDVAESRLLMRHWLESVGFEVCEACNGQEAVDIWADWHPHLICLDMRMPILDGYGVARHIRQTAAPDNPQAHPIILAVTASVFEEQQSVCLAAGCDAVLPKPIQREVLLEAVGQWLHLTYDYNSGQPALDSKEDGVPMGDRPLTHADLMHLPADWIAQLRQAAQAADDRQVTRLIAELPPHQHTLAAQLTHLVNDYRLDIILDLTAQPLLQGASSP
ncbi:hypothetical protein GFS31_16710 [Leptolyngbya sp. BL0902]|uniref:MHYT domain-containing protein n=1 Tax=Leptolyngbya sp. BL0902 TaxID=1115757 RepID=UPI0018E8E673|nr:MHYT domain-containing protein [Leptolyngbya sp. BL0902]QQE64986.1 hypothetical protein GFS31_16710 [Leptolyngbya sp. BL0902]